MKNESLERERGQHGEGNVDAAERKAQEREFSCEDFTCNEIIFHRARDRREVREIHAHE